MPKQRWVSYNRMRGQHASALEHATPEAFFIDKKTCGGANQPECQQAISAVKALQIAAQEGQKIYTITQANIATALPNISAGSSVIEEIQNAVAAGKEVTIHEKPIHAFGWSGSGYSVIDPEIGAGAYLIDGGANGGFIAGLAFGHVLGYEMMVLDIGASSPNPTAKGLIVPALESILITLAAIATVWAAYKSIYGDEVAGCFLTGVGIGLGAVAVELAVINKIRLSPLSTGLAGPFAFFLASLLVGMKPSTEWPKCI